MNGEADKIIQEFSMMEIPRHANGKVDVEKYREKSWQAQRAVTIKVECIDRKIQDNKIVRRLAYFASICLVLCASAIVFLHAGWEFATGTLGAGATMMKILSAIKNL